MKTRADQRKGGLEGDNHFLLLSIQICFAFVECIDKYAPSRWSLIEQETHNNAQTNKYDAQSHEKEEWKDKAKLANQLVSMVTCRPYPTDVMGRQKKGRAPNKDKETLEV